MAFFSSRLINLYLQQINKYLFAKRVKWQFNWRIVKFKIIHLSPPYHIWAVKLREEATHNDE